jgi:catechol 2,3-dioxygenase-like lactoylglutathione lyase family enzyme
MMVGSNDLDKAKAFYDALFLATGGREGRFDPKGRLMYLRKMAAFMVSAPIDGAVASIGNGSTVGFRLDSSEQVDAWHDAGVAAGGTSIEDPPGWRTDGKNSLYLAYLRDPDGNKLCGLFSE